MVIIAQKDFNLDMDAYLKKRRSPIEKKATRRKKKSKKEEEFSEEEKEYYTERSFFEKFLDFVVGEEPVQPLPEEEPGDVPEEELPPVKKSGGLFSTLKGWFYADETGVEVEVEEEVIHMIDDDLKEVLKLQNKWLQKLTPKKIKKFKSSDDYKKIKEILAKYNLIKEKEG